MGDLFPNTKFMDNGDSLLATSPSDFPDFLVDNNSKKINEDFNLLPKVGDLKEEEFFVDFSSAVPASAATEKNNDDDVENTPPPVMARLLDNNFEDLQRDCREKKEYYCQKIANNRKKACFTKLIMEQSDPFQRNNPEFI